MYSSVRRQAGSAAMLGCVNCARPVRGRRAGPRARSGCLATWAPTTKNVACTPCSASTSSDLRGPLRIRSVVEGQRDRPRRHPVRLHLVTDHADDGAALADRRRHRRVALLGAGHAVRREARVDIRAEQEHRDEQHKERRGEQRTRLCAAASLRTPDATARRRGSGRRRRRPAGWHGTTSAGLTVTVWLSHTATTNSTPSSATAATTQPRRRRRPPLTSTKICCVTCPKSTKCVAAGELRDR